jgi:hypothetical protein
MIQGYVLQIVNMEIIIAINLFKVPVIKIKPRVVSIMESQNKKGAKAQPRPLYLIHYYNFTEPE